MKRQVPPKSRIEGKLEPPDDEGYVDDHEEEIPEADPDHLSDQLLEALKLLRIRKGELKSAEDRFAEAKLEMTAAEAEHEDRKEAYDKAAVAMIKATDGR